MVLDSTWWTAFGAIAQALGALATFIAVGVSLWLALGERALRGKGKVSIGLDVAERRKVMEPTLVLELHNTGLRSLSWEGVSWRVGWFRWGPTSLRHKWARQRNAKASPFFGHVVEPALTARESIPLFMLQEMDESARQGFYGRRLPMLGAAPVAAFALVAGRPPIKLKVRRNVKRFLRTGRHGFDFEWPSEVL